MRYRAMYFLAALSVIVFSPIRIFSQKTPAAGSPTEAPAKTGKSTPCKATRLVSRSDHHASTKGPRLAEASQPEAQLTEAEKADEFMQLREQVNADLIRLEDLNDAKAMPNLVRDGSSGHAVKANVPVSIGNGKRTTELSVQESRAVPSESSKSTGASKQ